jgi:hypothetical protein
MRKLRNDITLKEAWEWAEDVYGDNEHGRYALRDLGKGFCNNKYPDSFYEQPPIGSFGRFSGTDENGECDTWGYLAEITPVCYVSTSGNRWPWFTPGLPTDVDADGHPKEHEDA